MQVIICGGGVIGACTAYFLSLRNVDITVVERTGVANAASGKSGGFIARDWCRGTPVDALAQRSFDLHAELAQTIASDWGYRRLDTLAVAASQKRDSSRYTRRQAPGWLAADAVVHDRIGCEETTAQVNPAQFTQGLMAAAQQNGARLVAGTVDGIDLSADGQRATGVRIDGTTLATDTLVIALGPWSILACQWLPLPAVYGLKGHSLVFRYQPSEPCALFVELETADGAIATPEVMPRTDGTTYVCGLSSESPLPLDPAAVVEDDGATSRLRELTAAVAPELAAVEVLATQACYRPITRDGIPIIGKVPGVEGAYVATGHSVWGMLNGPATGEALAELIVTGRASSVDLAPFDPTRLPIFDGELFE